MHLSNKKDSFPSFKVRVVNSILNQYSINHILILNNLDSSKFNKKYTLYHIIDILL